MTNENNYRIHENERDSKAFIESAREAKYIQEFIRVSDDELKQLSDNLIKRNRKIYEELAK